MMKSLELGYQKIDMCPKFCILYYLENVDLTECRTCGHTWYKPKTDRGKSLVAHKKMRYFPITLKLQMLFMSPKTIEHIT
jgi:Zn ribbon nucleic-acid-binding protein